MRVEGGLFNLGQSTNFIPLVLTVSFLNVLGDVLNQKAIHGWLVGWWTINLVGAADNGNEGNG